MATFSTRDVEYCFSSVFFLVSGELKANLETVTREAVFNIESRKSSLFKTRTENLCLKTFASHKNSFHSVECNFFSQ